MSRVFEHVEEAHLRNHWVRTTVNSVLDVASAYVKGENLVYFKAALELAAHDPDGFWRNALDLGDVCFHGHVRKGKKLVSCKAHWADEAVKAEADRRRVGGYQCERCGDRFSADELDDEGY